MPAVLGDDAVPTPSRSPAASAAVCTACEMSDEPAVGPHRRDPGLQRRLAGRRQGQVGRRTTAPTAMVTAASPCQPSRIAPQSTEIRSPSASTWRGAGMPCTICSFTDAQIDAG